MTDITIQQQELNDQEIVLSTFSKESFYLINKKSIRIIGVLPTIFLSDLTSKHRYFLKEKTLDSEGYFFSEQNYIEEETGLSKYEQRKATNVLESLGILKTKRIGIPQRIWYKINYSAVITNILKIKLLRVKDCIYNNKNKIEESTKVLNKDFSNPTYSKNDSSSKEKEQPIKVELPFLLKEWRTYQQTPKSQHHPKENSKTHQQIEKYTNRLINGTFGHHCAINPEFLKQHKISKSALSDKYSKEDLSDGVYEMSKMFQEGYYPENKDSISKRSFANLIYCPRTRISYLLKYLCKDAQLLEYKTVLVDGDWLDRIYEERLFSKDIENDNHQFGILKKGLFGIEQYYDWIAEKKLTHAQLKSADDLLDWYITWLTETNSNINSPYKIGPQDNTWFRFIKWLEEAVWGDFVSQHASLDKRKYNK